MMINSDLISTLQKTMGYALRCAVVSGAPVAENGVTNTDSDPVISMTRFRSNLLGWMSVDTQPKLHSRNFTMLESLTTDEQ